MANDFRTDTAIEVAETVLDVLEDLGDVAYYSCRSAAELELVVLPEAMTNEIGEVINVKTDSHKRQFLAPMQAGFPPTSGIATNDTLRYDGVKYKIDRIENRDSIGALWRLFCSYEKARKAGAIGV